MRKLEMEKRVPAGSFYYNLKPIELQLGHLFSIPLACKPQKTEKVEERLKECVRTGRSIKLLYGETFDGTNTLDSLMYYLVLSAFFKVIERDYGIKPEATVLVADLNELINRGSNLEKVRMQAESRIRFIEKIRNAYNCSFDIVLQSDIFHDRTGEVEKACRRNPEFMEAVYKTLPYTRWVSNLEITWVYSIRWITD